MALPPCLLMSSETRVLPWGLGILLGVFVGSHLFSLTFFTSHVPVLRPVSSPCFVFEPQSVKRVKVGWGLDRLSQGIDNLP